MSRSERRPGRVRVGVSTCDSRERSHLPLLAIESAQLTVNLVHLMGRLQGIVGQRGRMQPEQQAERKDTQRIENLQGVVGYSGSLEERDGIVLKGPKSQGE
jgi:hypothetical protein